MRCPHRTIVPKATAINTCSERTWHQFDQHTTSTYIRYNSAPMKPSAIVALISIALVGGTVVFVSTADHQERLPEIYDSLDKSKPWNELAENLDPRMSDGEYDEMRTQYFYDVVVPQLNNKSETFAAYGRFMRLTDRPWQWNRRASRGSPPPIMLPVLWASAAYLMIFLLVWMWRKVLRPAGLIVRDEGLSGAGKVILHGRNSRTHNTGT